MHKQGKTPSVAILRAKAPFKVSVTEAIEALKRFHAHKTKLDAPNEENVLQQNHATTAEQSNTLHARVDILEKEVADLKRALHKIISAQ